MIGKALKYMRIKRDYKQENLAKILNVGQTTLSGWERGFREPTFEKIEEIAKICNFTIVFKDNKTNEEITLNSLKRKDI